MEDSLRLSMDYVVSSMRKEIGKLIALAKKDSTLKKPALALAKFEASDLLACSLFQVTESKETPNPENEFRVNAANSSGS